MFTKPLSRSLLLALVPALAACTQEDSHPQVSAEALATQAAELAPADRGLVTTMGSCENVFGGDICTWSKSRGGELVSFGATLPMTTVENAPPEGEMAWPPITEANVLMPPEVTAKTGYDHLGVNWEVYGHPPRTFMTPHFDLHFYSMPVTDVLAITCEDVTKPDPADLPEGYILPDDYIEEMNVMMVGLCVPEMGMHALSAAAAELEEFFDSTMIVGYIYGKPHFIEPMVAKHALMRREDFSTDIPKFGGRPDGLADPVEFHAYYDAEADAYQLTFSMVSSG